MGMGDLKGNYSSSYEMIVFAGGNREFLNRPKNIIQCRFSDERFHNTQKPVELIKQLIDNSTNVNETIFDPFLGSGSTVVAAKEMKRNFIGCEIDEQNYKITLKRLEDGK
jgi:site-specific DNA-methyltransferase (adenine-specific)